MFWSSLHSLNRGYFYRLFNYFWLTVIMLQNKWLQNIIKKKKYSVTPHLKTNTSENKSLFVYLVIRKKKMKYSCLWCPFLLLFPRGWTWHRILWSGFCKRICISVKCIFFLNSFLVWQEVIIINIKKRSIKRREKSWLLRILLLRIYKDLNLKLK